LDVARLSDPPLNADLSAEDMSASAAAKESSEARIAADVPVIPLATIAVSLDPSARARGLQANAEADGPFWNAEQWSVS
ncbi:MAG TPA: hypothetical protein VJ818_02220, partial [Actinomycetota bacterium]|nr:hypothetical protein [Actinomycetota bacterium]